MRLAFLAAHHSSRNLSEAKEKNAAAAVSANPQQEYTEVSTQGEQTEAEGDWVDSKEVNTVQMSEATRKAIQAEKARNAAENDSSGGAITIIAMCIVLSALVILTLWRAC